MTDLPPQSLDAEESVLGACLLAPGAVDACAEILTPEMFYRPSHGTIFKAILDVAEKEEPVDALTVVGRLDADGKFNSDLTAERVHELSAIVPAASNAAHYAKIVRAMWIRREIASVGHQLISLGDVGAESVTNLLAEADRKMLSISQVITQGKSSPVFTGKQLAERFRYRQANPQEFSSSIVPPFYYLEDQIVNGQLHVLAGYQGTGKTALLWQFAESAAEGGAKVGIETLEMTPDQLTDRLAKAHGPEKALEMLEKWDIEIINDPHVTPESIRRRQRQSKYDLILIDHLHRFPIKNPAHVRIEIAEAVKKLTNIALEYGVPIILLAQLSRATIHDPFPRPTTAQLKETSQIETDAAVIWFVWRRFDGFQFETEAEFITAKHRFGSPGWQRLEFKPRRVRFEIA